jgi:ketosteroid isomerase-like protein
MGGGVEGATHRVVDALYVAFLAGDAEDMLALMADDVEIRFLGQVRLRGTNAARAFMSFSADLLEDLDFTVERMIVDGEWAAVTWSETARTRTGAPWENHGVDVVRVEEEKITLLHENNDVRLVHRFFPPYEEF